jgi:hypothetical protein
MAFQVAAGETATAIILDVDHDLRASFLGPRVDFVGIRDNDICGLRLSAADFIRLLEQLAVFVLMVRA